MLSAWLFRFASYEYNVPHDSKPTLSELVLRVRKTAQTQLARYAKLEPEDCKELYLFRADQFCGVRFTLGPFQADWRIDQSVLNLSRDGNQIDRIELDPTQGKRAA